MNSKYIGKNYLRKEGPSKITGKAQYIDDITMPGMLHGITVRSQIARGKIKKIEFDPHFDWKNFTVVTAKDIPAKNVVALILPDQPYLADSVINHPEEAVVLLAHADREKVIEARNHVRIVCDEMPAVFTIEDSLNKKHIIWGQDNIFKEFHIRKGDGDFNWKKADYVVEEEYRTGAQEHLYIENNGVIAVANPKTGVTVWGSLQCPYYVHKALVSLFGMNEEQIRIIQTETGGGFGGKEEYPSMIAGHAALLAWKSGKPVKLIYDRLEDMVATTKRHPSKTKIKMALSKSGKIEAVDIDFVLDGGAYCTLSPVVLSRGGIHSAGPYLIPNVKIRARAVATNTPPQGAFRGFGAPQSIFAMERHLDRAAKALKITPEKIREINLIRDGEMTATSQVIKDGVDMRALMARGLKLSNYHANLKKFAKENKNSHIKRGMGFATFMHGSGFTGSGEKNLASIVGVEADAKGVVHVLASSTEIGQGKNTVFAQIAAEVLDLPVDLIEITQPDTRKVPNSGPTVASRTVMVVGKLVDTACENLKQTLITSGFLKKKYSASQWKDACKQYIKNFGPLKVYSQYKQPPSIQWDEHYYKGDAYAAYAWAVYVAQVAVDTRTYETTVEDFVALQEIGKVVNPILAEGQIEGGVAQAVGYALYEKVTYKDGKMINNQMTNYIMPTAMDVPPIRVFFEEVQSPFGPGGAKGIGELPMDGAAPAILNAVENALNGQVLVGKKLDVMLPEIPLTPEELFSAVELSR